jgi:hypothetical protein
MANDDHIEGVVAHARRLGVTMGFKFYTIKYKDWIELGSVSISIHFLTKIIWGPSNL